MRAGGLVDAYRVFRSFLFDPRQGLRKLRGIGHFARNAYAYRRASNGSPFPLRLRELHYTAYERYMEAGAARGHYFHQDLWAARLVARSGAEQLVDVGSRIDGFVAHVLPFCRVQYVDIRPFKAEVEGLRYVPGSILRMPFENDALSLLTCLHVIEHIGLGRYGDDLDVRGPWRAAAELERVLAPGGRLLLGTPVGRERLMFDAHRVFDPDTVVEMFPGLRLEEFSLIDDAGLAVVPHASFAAARACEYGCGLFVFTKPPQ